MVTSILKPASLETFGTFGKTLEISWIFSGGGVQRFVCYKAIALKSGKILHKSYNYFIQSIKGARKMVLKLDALFV